jgi:branched-chain amino acid transport system substrate-binding protein
VFTRREALRRAGLRLGGLSLSASLLSACAGTGFGSSTQQQPPASTTSAPRGTLRIAFFSPHSGPEAALGAADQYVIDLVRKALAPGVPAGGKVYTVDIVRPVGQQGPSDLLTAPGVDLFLATGAEDVVMVVAEAAERAGVPCISTGVPWEAWVAGRGGKLDASAPFKWTFHFAPGMTQYLSSATALWPQVLTNRRVGVLWPHDAVGGQLRALLVPQLEKAHYSVVDPGAPAAPAGGWSDQIAALKSAGCEILSGLVGPEAFLGVCHAMVEQGFAPHIAQFGAEAMIPTQIQALGPPGLHLSSACFWHPTWPYSSTLTGLSSADLADGYQAATRQHWVQQLGATLALFEVATAAVIASGAPTDPEAVAGAMRTLTVDTMAGHLAWGTGPNENVVATPVAGGQWARPNGNDPVDFVICENSCDGDIPVGGQLLQYR